jgi:RNA polymerase sigma-70 factor (ECF subfamily)
MAKSLLRTDNEIAEIYRRHFNTVYRVCFAFLKNPADAEDAAADTFLRMIRSAPPLKSTEHEKAWLIRTAANTCKDALKHWWRRREALDDQPEPAAAEPDGVLEAVCALPEKYKAAVLLYYYDGYSGPEIASMLRKPHSTVRNTLHEARNILRETLGGDFQ